MNLLVIDFVPAFESSRTHGLVAIWPRGIRDLGIRLRVAVRWAGLSLRSSIMLAGRGSSIALWITWSRNRLRRLWRLVVVNWGLLDWRNRRGHSREGDIHYLSHKRGMPKGRRLGEYLLLRWRVVNLNGNLEYHVSDEGRGMECHHQIILHVDNPSEGVGQHIIDHEGELKLEEACLISHERVVGHDTRVRGLYDPRLQTAARSHGIEENVRDQ